MSEGFPGEETDIAAYRQWLTESLPSNGSLMGPYKYLWQARIEALTFLNSVEVAHAKMVDMENTFPESHIRNLQVGATLTRSREKVLTFDEKLIGFFARLAMLSAPLPLEQKARPRGNYTTRLEGYRHTIFQDIATVLQPYLSSSSTTQRSQCVA